MTTIAEIAAEFGTPTLVVRQLFPDLIRENAPDDMDIRPAIADLMRRSWNEKFGKGTIFDGKAPDFIVTAPGNADYGKSAYPAEPDSLLLDSAAMKIWRQIRLQLASDTSGKWAVSIDPFDPTGQIYIMITLFGEIKWSDRGPELADMLAGTLMFLKEAME
jgi:hypothetical protein